MTAYSVRYVHVYIIQYHRVTCNDRVFVVKARNSLAIRAVGVGQTANYQFIRFAFLRVVRSVTRSLGVVEFTIAYYRKVCAPLQQVAAPRIFRRARELNWNIPARIPARESAEAAAPRRTNPIWARSEW
jgi:hypothetical protein